MNAIRLATMVAPNIAGSGPIASASETARCAANRSSMPTSASVAAEASRPSWVLSTAVTRAASAGSAAACTAPLWGMARAKRPAARGATIMLVTLMAPADSPKIVTLPGSPPNAAMFCCTHSNAAIWSSSPRFTGASGSSAKPSTPSL